jgi:hypothetical protein
MISEVASITHFYLCCFFAPYTYENPEPREREREVRALCLRRIISDGCISSPAVAGGSGPCYSLQATGTCRVSGDTHALLLISDAEFTTVSSSVRVRPSLQRPGRQHPCGETATGPLGDATARAGAGPASTRAVTASACSTVRGAEVTGRRDEAVPLSPVPVRPPPTDGPPRPVTTRLSN